MLHKRASELSNRSRTEADGEAEAEVVEVEGTGKCNSLQGRN